MLQLQMFFHEFVGKLHRDEDGQTAVEYALVLALVAIVLVLALATGLGGALNSVITKITNLLT
jgi:Flp pilus assembly pilin Flp